MKVNLLKSDYLEEAGGEGGAGGSGGDGGEGGKTALDDVGEFAAVMEAIPEKFHAFTGEGDDKAFDLGSTATKIASSYSELESRFRSGETGAKDMPDTPEGYSLEAEPFGENFDIDSVMKDPSTKNFLKGAHAKGMGKAQVQYVMEHALKEMLPNAIRSNFETDAANCDAKLCEVFKDQRGADQAKLHAAKAMQRVTDGNSERFEALKGKFGNDPDFIQFAADIGKEMREDSPANIEKITGGVDIEQLVNSEAHLDPKHPDHKRVTQQVAQYYQALHGDKIAI